MYNRLRIYLAKQFKFSVGTILTLWMTRSFFSVKTIFAKNFRKENVKNVVTIWDLSIEILEIAKK